MIERDVTPGLGYIAKSPSISRRDVLDVIDAIVDIAARLVMARRLTQLILHRLFKWAVGRGIGPIPWPICLSRETRLSATEC